MGGSPKVEGKYGYFTTCPRLGDLLYVCSESTTLVHAYEGRGTRGITLLCTPCNFPVFEQIGFEITLNLISCFIKSYDYVSPKVTFRNVPASSVILPATQLQPN